MLQQENSILMIHNLKDYIETWAVNDQMNWHHVDPLKCLSFDQ